MTKHELRYIEKVVHAILTPTEKLYGVSTLNLILGVETLSPADTKKRLRLIESAKFKLERFNEIIDAAYAQAIKEAMDKGVNLR